MQDNLTHSDFMEWVEYFARFPTHTDRSEIQLAKQSQIIASQNAKTPVDFYDYTITYKKEVQNTDKDDGSYIDKKGRRILSSKNIDKLLDSKFAA